VSAATAALQETARAFRLPLAAFGDMRQREPDFACLAYAEALRRGCLLLRGEGLPWVVLADPRDGGAQDWIEERLREPFEYRLAARADLEAIFAVHEAALRAIGAQDAYGEADSAARNPAQDISIEAIGGAESPVVRLVNATLHDALKTGASDIHLETTPTGLAVKYRIDGVLSRVATVEGVDFADQAISRVKVLAELDIAERRIPQDGRFKAANRGREVDFRVSVMPSAFGEDAVLRVLDKRALAGPAQGVSLEQLGFEAATAATLRRLAREPHGMLLVTGPTGSGKTTTLYSVISEVNRGTEKIVTIEDPVEYQLPGILQIPVNERKGLTFARGLRSILRHDPDRIMVGEIRDPETAEIAVQSALTGHLVYTTVHANNVFDVMGRFLHMGVDTFNFAAALNAVMAQRLVRVACAACGGAGCAACRGSGFKGRKAVAELLVLDDALRELFVSRAPLRQLKEAARTAGLRTLRQAALELVARGETTQEEADRVTFVDR